MVPNKKMPSTKGWGLEYMPDAIFNLIFANLDNPSRFHRTNKHINKVTAHSMVKWTNDPNIRLSNIKKTAQSHGFENTVHPFDKYRNSFDYTNHMKIYLKELHSDFVSFLYMIINTMEKADSGTLRVLFDYWMYTNHSTVGGVETFIDKFRKDIESVIDIASKYHKMEMAPGSINTFPDYEKYKAFLNDGIIGFRFKLEEMLKVLKWHQYAR